MSPSYCTTWSSLVLAHFRFLLDHMLFHMLVFYWHTCHVAVRSHVNSSLDQVSYFYWSTWHDHNIPCLSFTRPCVSMLYVHVSVFYWATCRALSYPCFFCWFNHMVGWICTTYFICISPRALSWLLHVSFTCSSTCQILIYQCAYAKSTTCTPIITSEKMISDLHCCTKWLHA